ncbi:MAG: D-glycero-beta-D-manno-heptose-1,7-bisphosphate 7-phosphatase [Thiotrichales bacterium]|nr:MAG: D-glycero-beta-D-manno-heptose-1,7-bisphosphate 7-phosphatase [Thiotrichales bacterium]
MAIKLIILDRDGVINYDSPGYIKAPEEWQAIPGSLQAIANLNKAGITVAVATNQSGIARRYYSLQTLHIIHKKMYGELQAVAGNIDKLVYCPHGPNNNCKCRKPRPGMLQTICKHYNIVLPSNQVIFIGDSIRDVEAARMAGIKPILVLTGNGNKTVLKHPQLERTVPIYKDLATAVSDFV